MLRNWRCYQQISHTPPSSNTTTSWKNIHKCYTEACCYKSNACICSRLKYYIVMWMAFKLGNIIRKIIWCLDFGTMFIWRVLSQWAWMWLWSHFRKFSLKRLALDGWLKQFAKHRDAFAFCWCSTGEFFLWKENQYFELIWIPKYKQFFLSKSKYICIFCISSYANTIAKTYVFRSRLPFISIHKIYRRIIFE